MVRLPLFPLLFPFTCYHFQWLESLFFLSFPKTCRFWFSCSNPFCCSNAFCVSPFLFFSLSILVDSSPPSLFLWSSFSFSPYPPVTAPNNFLPANAPDTNHGKRTNTIQNDGRGRRHERCAHGLAQWTIHGDNYPEKWP